MTKNSNQTVTIEAPSFSVAEITLVGISPYVMNKFSAKAREQMRLKQEAGSRAKKGAAREGKDFMAVYEGAKHISRQGWVGIPAPSIRNAMISACRLAGFKMTLAKLSLFVEAEGYDADDGTPLVKIDGEPRVHEALVRNATGVADVRWRPMWEEWSVKLRVRWDASQFNATDIVNLLSRAGMQVGIGEGRPDSKSSAGMGWGMFEVRP